MIEFDILFEDVGKYVIEKNKVSIGMIQRCFKIGFNRAARILDQLYEAGVIGKEDGIQPRKIIMNPDEFDDLISNMPTYLESMSFDKPLCLSLIHISEPTRPY